MEFLIPVLVVLALIFFMVYVSKSGRRMIKEQNEKIKRSETGKAKIIGLTPYGHRGTTDFGQYQGVKLILEVWSEHKQPYRAETCWNVGVLAAPYLKIGNDLNVKIDADNPGIIYPSRIPSVEFSFAKEKIKKKK